MAHAQNKTSFEFSAGDLNASQIGNFNGLQSSTASLVSYNPGSVSNEVINIMRILFDCVLIQILCLLGVAGNTINLIVLSHHGYKDTTNIILSALSVSDLILSVTESLYRLRYIIERFDVYTAKTVSTISHVSFYKINEIALVISNILLAVVAVERMIAVCFPFHVSRLITQECMKIFVCVLSVVVVGLCSVVFGYEYTAWRKNELTNRTYLVYIETLFYQENYATFIVPYVNGFLTILSSPFPFAVILVCTSVIIVKLSLSSQSFSNLSRQTKSKRTQELKSVKMTLVLCLSISFLMLMPTSIFEFIVFFYEDALNNLTTNELNAILICLQIPYQLSASINFIIYVTTSSKFNKTYRKLFC